MNLTKLTPAEKTTVDFYQNEWKNIYPVNKPFTLNNFVQHYIFHKKKKDPICKNSMKTYFSKILHKKLGLIKPIVDTKYGNTKGTGTGSKFWINAKIDFFKTALGEKLYPTVGGFLVTHANINRKVEECVVRDNIKVTYKVTYGYTQKLMDELHQIDSRIKYNDIYNSLVLVLRKHSNIMPRSECNATKQKIRKQNMEKYGLNDMIEDIQSRRPIHNAPKPEYAVNDAIQDKIWDLPRGGAGIALGTQGAIMVPSKKLRKVYNYLCLCNLVTLHTLAKSCNTVPLTNVVGDAVDLEKSNYKFTVWETCDVSKNWNNFKERVDENCIRKHVSYLADRHDLVKVLIMNSGSLRGTTMVKHNLKANFKRVIQELVAKYPHVHIIAMQMVNGKRFCVRYFHQEKNEQILC